LRCISNTRSPRKVVPRLCDEGIQWMSP
jgi:hypothetical protein